MSKLRGIVDRIIEDKIASALPKLTETSASSAVTDTALRAQVEALSDAMGSEVSKLRTENTSLKAAVAAISLEPVPVGTIIQSALTQTELNGLDGEGVWQLCDGGNTPGTKYATITKRTTVPDLRGSFLRGAGTRTGVTGWVGGTVNTHVEDSTRPPRSTNFSVEHRDPMRYGDSSRGIAGATYGSGEAYLRPGLNTVTVTGGDPETRPKHYTVNYFIRVN
jgi:hypothetical protein